MITIEEKQVKEFSITIAGATFKVHAETKEQAVKKLMAQLRTAIAELQEHKGQNKNQSQPTA